MSTTPRAISGRTPRQGLAAGAASQTFSFDRDRRPVAGGGFSFAGPAGSQSADRRDLHRRESARPRAHYSATINWGDGSPSAGTVGAGFGGFAVNGNHTYAGRRPTPPPDDHAGGSNASTPGRRHDLRAADARHHGRPDVGQHAAAFAGSVNPDGLPTTTAHFEYGLDRRYITPGASGPQYDHSTPAQSVGLGLLEPLGVGIGLGPGSQRPLPRAAGRDERRRDDRRPGHDVHDPPRFRCRAHPVSARRSTCRRPAWC